MSLMNEVLNNLKKHQSTQYAQGMVPATLKPVKSKLTPERLKQIGLYSGLFIISTLVIHLVFPKKEVAHQALLEPIQMPTIAKNELVTIDSKQPFNVLVKEEVAHYLENGTAQTLQAMSAQIDEQRLQASTAEVIAVAPEQSADAEASEVAQLAASLSQDKQANYLLNSAPNEKVALGDWPVTFEVPSAQIPVTTSAAPSSPSAVAPKATTGSTAESSLFKRLLGLTRKPALKDEAVEAILANESPDKALKLLEEQFKTMPDNRYVREALVQLYLSNNKLEKALPLVQENMRLDRNNPVFIRQYIQASIKQGNLEGVISFMEQEPLDIQTQADLYALLASLYQRTGRHTRAMDVYTKLIEQHPNEGRYWAAMGASLEAHGKLPSAVDSYQRAYGLLDASPPVKAYVRDRLAILGAAPAR